MTIGMWWHERVRKHHLRRSRVSVSLYDIGAKGWLVRCDCGKIWAI